MGMRAKYEISYLVAYVWCVRFCLLRRIRFGASPTGNLRFRPPQKPEPWWNHVKDASWFGNSCPQDDFFSVLTETSEDCLFLNVYTPANATKGSDIPVILFFYGGSWTGGSASFFLYWANQDISYVFFFLLKCLFGTYYVYLITLMLPCIMQRRRRRHFCHCQLQT